ncbi:MAG: T9SS type A sorting domain-containing protein [Bacteroidetes bacterium]|nr:T9SS type A sorting domain-containing protein [Bacteroidota bacterium]
MKKLYTFSAALLAAFALTAQVNVTYQVDITDYLAEGNILGENGMRIGGNFTDQGATVAGSAMPNWSPSDGACALTDLGNNVWSITVTYDNASIGNEQLYKYVNNDWGAPGVANEGGDLSNIGADGCGLDDGAGNINRMFLIPSSDVTVGPVCWEQCSGCGGVSSLEELVSVQNMMVGPNPTQDVVTFTFDLDRNAMVNISLFDILGSKVEEISDGQMTVGQHVIVYDAEKLANGTYFYRMQAASAVTTGKLIKH